MKIKIVLGVVVLLVAGVGAIQSTAWYSKYRGEQRVREMLKNPDAAVFRGVYYYHQTKGICGEVSEKNSMGGYVGFNDFFVDADGVVAFYPEKDDHRPLSEVSPETAKKRLEYLDIRLKICPDVNVEGGVSG
ncbi:hypothetical protein ACO0LC_28610 [Undibacterium sp. JH2W]|uniref:hypothetical protein n=1 Tax=Undibacterium sp. JH2W TaxID=3413037 RepID=UPI003BEFB66A